ncbi:leucine-rich repeat domain-containing protein, partial [bacterium]|nr:leucine-rich repeat domain-containing protein [bacterium]
MSSTGGQVLPGTSGATEVQNLSKISAVSFAKPLTTLSPYAFNGANYLASVDLSSCTSLASVSQNAFSGTQNLTSVKFSNTIDTIGNNAFSGVNAKLTTLTLPANLAMVGDNAFNGCSQLSTLTVDSTSLSIGISAFSGCDLSALDFSKAVGGLIIGTSAFSNNKNLKTLKLATENLEPDSQTQIKSQAFSGCTNLDLQPVTQGPGDTTNPTPAP